MLEITGELITVTVKKSDLHPDKWCLVHDGKKVIVLISPGRRNVWTGENRVMLVGTEQKLRTEIIKLGLSSTSISEQLGFIRET